MEEENIYPEEARLLAYATSYSVLATLMGGVVILLMEIIYLRNFWFNGEHSGLFVCGLGTFAQIWVGNMIIPGIARRMTELENHKFDTEYALTPTPRVALSATRTVTPNPTALLPPTPPHCNVHCYPQPQPLQVRG